MRRTTFINARTEHICIICNVSVYYIHKIEYKKKEQNCQVKQQSTDVSKATAAAAPAAKAFNKIEHSIIKI